MFQTSVCIEMIFRDQPILSRIAAVKKAGLPAFEFWGWKDKDLKAIRQKADECGLAIAASVVQSDAALVDPSGTGAFVDGVSASIEAAQQLGCNVLIATVGQEIAELSRWAQHDSIVAGLSAAAPMAEDADVTLVLEPLNILVDHKGYYLASSHEGFDIVRAVDSSHVRLLYDIYHQQITEGNLIANISANIDLIGHVHVADVPGRYEPGTGEINYANVFAKIAELGYEGYVGLEFRPSGDHYEALAKVKSLLP
jgi:hydroxypyruvate isomerase